MRLATLLLLFVSAIAAGADKTFDWTNPTQNTDGTPLDELTLTLFEVGCTSIDDQNYLVISIFVASQPLPTSRTVPFDPGPYFCALRVLTANASSDWSNQVSFTVPHPVPNAPTDFAVN